MKPGNLSWDKVLIPEDENILAASGWSVDHPGFFVVKRGIT